MLDEVRLKLLALLLLEVHERLGMVRGCAREYARARAFALVVLVRGRGGRRRVGDWRISKGFSFGPRRFIVFTARGRKVPPPSPLNATTAHLKIVVEVLEDQVQLAVAVHDVFEPHDVRVDQILQERDLADRRAWIPWVRVRA